MIFVLAGMVGYLYWQQTNMLQHLQGLAMATATLADQLVQEEVHVVQEDHDEDDRVSVKDVEIVEGPPKTESTPTATSVSEDDTDDLQSKTAAELRDLLTKKGIPFGKRDSKTTLLELLKAVN